MIPAAGNDGPPAGLLPPRPAFLDSTWYALSRAGSLARQRWAGMIADFGVSPGQYKVLMTLSETGPLCQQALSLFVSLYGAAAGNLALKFMATGGVYVGGGIAPKILPKLEDGTFMRAFLDKGRMRGLLDTVPVHVIRNPKTALLGAALCAARLL